VDCAKCRPGGAVDLVSAVDAARHARGRSVSEEWDRWMTCGHDEGGADWLLAEELIHDPVLHLPHYLLAEEPHHDGVNPCRHQPERVSRCHEAVVRLQVLKFAPNDPNIWQTEEATAKRFAHRLFGVDQPEMLQHSSLLRLL